MSVEEGFLAKICDRCKVALYYPHPENHLWVKCELCGHCKCIPKK